MRRTPSLLHFGFVFIILFSLVQHANAATTVTRGAQSPSINIHWDIVAGSGTCNGTTNYPGNGTTGDTLKGDWETSHSPSTGDMSVNRVNGNSGAGFPQIYTFWCQDASSGAISNDTITVNDCGVGTSWDGSACVAPAVNGSCNATHYACNAGSSSANTPITNGYTWSCDGTGGGSNASCNECTGGTSWNGSACVATPINGVCAGTHYNCTTGTYASDGVLSNGTYSWTCNGSNGGSNSGTCTESCSATAATINNIAWTPASIAYNDASTVSWSTSNAVSCTVRSSLTGTEVSTALNNVAGSLYANRTANDTWSISCKNSCDVRTATSSALLTVAPLDNAPTGTATAVQCGLASGNASDSDSAATQLTIGIAIDGGAEQTTTTSGGGHTFSYQTSSVGAGSHSYVIRARGVDTGGVQNGNNPIIGSGNFTCTTPTVSLTANGLSSVTVTKPTDTVTLAWSTTNLNVTGSTCTASNDGGLAWSGAKATTSGSESSPSMTAGVTYIYTLSCTKPGMTGTYSDSATVTEDSVTVNPTITASSPNIQSGGNSDLVFGNTTGAVQCDFYKNGVFNKTQPGSGGAIGATINSGALASGVYTYMYTCKNAYGQWGSSPTATVTAVTDAVCGASHYSCTSGSSVNNVANGSGWTWDCNSTDGGANASCTENGYTVTTSIYYRPGATGSISPLGVTTVASGDSQTVTITPTGSSMIYARTIDGVTETVSGVAPVSTANIDFNNITANHIASTTLYVPAPITVTVTEVSGIADTQHLGDNVTLRWTTTGDKCNIYDFAGSALIKTVGIVNPANASTVLAAAPADLPSTVGKFGYVVRCTDSQDINRGSGEDTATITLDCPRDPLSYHYTIQPPVAPADFNSCTNDAPIINLDLGNQTIVLGQSITYTSTANDATADMVAHQFEWMTPSGGFSWGASPQGSVSYDTSSIFQATPQGSHAIQATFTPTVEGTYRVRSVVKDDNLNSSLSGYFTPPSGRLTYSQTNFNNAPRVTVTRRAGATIVPIDIDTFRWTCYNTDFMSLQRFDGAATSTVIGYRSMPPVSGTFDATAGTQYYSLLCESTIDKAVAVYFPPTITQNSVTPTTVDLAYNCNTPSAQSALIERSGGTGLTLTSTSDTSTSTFVQSGLTAQTDYTYKLRCFDGPIVSGSVTGNQIGVATLDVTTPNIIVDPNPIVIDANIRGKSGDPSTLTTATTTDGSFYDWTYTITAGTPTSCVMSQQNDGAGWYSNVPPDTDPSTYTLAWSSMLTSDKQAFVNSFMNQHDWKITCINPLGTITTKVWSLVKIKPSIPIIDTITQPVAGPVIANVTLHCSPAATDYKIRNSSDVIVQTGAGTSGIGSIAWDPTVAGDYKITCDDGPIVIVSIRPTMWDPVFRMTGSSKTLGNTSSVTLTWDISNPDATCKIWADVTLPATCDATCLANRTAASTTINALIQSANTDANDPYWPNGNGIRTVTEALTQPAHNTPNARGKVTFTGIKYGTTFIGQCNGTPQVKVKVGVTTVNEG